MSVCINLINELSHVTKLHIELEELLTDLDQEFTPDKLAAAHQLKELIKQTTKELKPTFDIGIEQVLKEKWDFDFEQQLEIYSECKQTEWVSYPNNPHNKSIILKKFLSKENRASIEAKRAVDMKPYLMPSREVQQEDWEDSIRKLCPYWRDASKNEKRITNEPKFHKEYIALMSQQAAWVDIPNEPYIAWTNPTQKVDPSTINMNFAEQTAFIAKKSWDENNPTQPSLLYSKRELSPLEYSVLQTMHTRFQKKKSDHDLTNANIIPLDYWDGTSNCSYTRFPTIGQITQDDALRGYFNYIKKSVSFYFDTTGESKESGIRLVGRL